VREFSTKKIWLIWKRTEDRYKKREGDRKTYRGGWPSLLHWRSRSAKTHLAKQKTPRANAKPPSTAARITEAEESYGSSGSELGAV